jgi:RNA polymerase sigma-70 factor (sigma-E family)
VSTGFDEWAAARGAALTRFGYLLTNDAHLAQDLTQEALARVHLRWQRLASEGNPDAYARKVMVNQLTSWRRRRSFSERATDEIDPAAATVQFDQTATDRQALWELIQDLPTRQRAVVVLRYYEDLDDTAIGRILGCAPSTVRVHLRRALKALRTHPIARDFAGRTT